MRQRYAVLENHEVSIIDVSTQPGLLKWAQWFGLEQHKQIQFDTVGQSKVSTVFLGIDHGFFGPPLWFETIIFEGPFQDFTARYPTFETAMEGHLKVVQMIIDGKDPVSQR